MQNDDFTICIYIYVHFLNRGNLRLWPTKNPVFDYQILFTPLCFSVCFNQFTTTIIDFSNRYWQTKHVKSYQNSYRNIPNHFCGKIQPLISAQYFASVTCSSSTSQVNILLSCQAIALSQLKSPKQKTEDSIVSNVVVI